MTLTVWDSRPEPALNAVVDEAFQAVAKVAELMSFHDPGSELSRLNNHACSQPQPVHPWTLEVLRQALDLAAESDGAFDPTIAPHLEKWGILPTFGRLPSSRGDYRDIELTAQGEVRFHRPLHVDLGGIAKGFAVDQAVAVFREHGLAGGSADAGGDLRLFGTAASNPPALQIRHPRRPRRDFLTIPMLDESVATSAGYFSPRRHWLRRVSPLVRPSDGRAFTGKGSVSVFASTAMLADALTKIVLFSPRERWLPLLAKHHAQAILMTAQGEIEKP